MERLSPELRATTAACWIAVQEGSARPDDWFPESERGMDKWNQRAIRICTGCPIRQDCLRWALLRMMVGPMDSIPGIWGGTTYSQRVRIVRRHHGS